MLGIEQFQQKCAAVLRPDLRKHKELERFRDSEKSGNALDVDTIAGDTFATKGSGEAAGSLAVAMAARRKLPEAIEASHGAGQLLDTGEVTKLKRPANTSIFSRQKLPDDLPTMQVEDTIRLRRDDAQDVRPSFHRTLVRRSGRRRQYPP